MGKPKTIPIGTRSGRLVVTGYAGRIGRTDAAMRVICRCDCGAERIVVEASLKSPTGTKSCGCLLSDMNKARSTHGMRNTRAYYAWTNMKLRCYDRNQRAYPDYGGRGIKVCDEWRDSFSAFLADMGEPPAGLSLDRVDNAKGYSKDNCRWATKTQQSQNKRTTKMDPASVVEIRRRRDAGETLIKIASSFGISEATACNIAKRKTWTNVP